MAGDGRIVMRHTFYYPDGSAGMCKSEEELAQRRESSSWFDGPVVEVVDVEEDRSGVARAPA